MNPAWRSNWQGAWSRIALSMAAGATVVALGSTMLSSADAAGARVAAIPAATPVGGATAKQHICSVEDPCPGSVWTSNWRDGNQGRTRGRIPERIQRMAYRAWMKRWSAPARAGKDWHKAGVSFDEWCDRSAGYTFLCAPVRPSQGCVISSYVCKPKDVHSNLVFINKHTDWSDVDRILSKCTRNSFLAVIFGAKSPLGMWGSGGGMMTVCLLNETD